MICAYISTHYTIDHAEKMHELPDEYLADAMPIAKKIAVALGSENYNILQNNGKLAHQVGNLAVVALANSNGLVYCAGGAPCSFPRHPKAERRGGVGCGMAFQAHG